MSVFSLQLYCVLTGGASTSVSSSAAGRELQRGFPYGLPVVPPGGAPGLEQFLRMPNVYPPGSREASVNFVAEAYIP